MARLLLPQILGTVLRNKNDLSILPLYADSGLIVKELSLSIKFLFRVVLTIIKKTISQMRDSMKLLYIKLDYITITTRSTCA